MKLLGLFLLCMTFCNGAKILGIFNHPGGSHTFLGKILLKNLVKRGHEVVMISSFPMTELIPNYRDIVLSEHLEDLKRRNEKYFQNSGKGFSLQELRNMTLQHTEDTFTHPEVRKLLQSGETFDLIILDWFYNEASLMFGHIYKAPVIYLSSFGNMVLLNGFSGNVLPYSYVPGAGLLIHDDMSFKYRAIMTLFNIANSLFIPRRNSAHYDLLKRHFHNPPTIEELQENVAVVLSNSHFSFETPRPYTPNIIPVGGMHVEDAKELPQDLKKFLDGAKEGVIFFSLGSQIKSTNLNENVFRSILKTLGSVKQKVLWKYEDELPDLAKNIKIAKWVPQLEVLAHPNVKLFITHGGMLSLIEAIHYHVPMIVLPFNGDQNMNAAFVQSRNIGFHILPDEVTEYNLLEAIEEVIYNPKYQEEANYRSSLLREQPVKPLDLAIYWVEHVLKHRRGDHLKTFATKLPWYKYYLVDVIGFFLCVLFVVFKLTMFLAKKCLRGACYLLNVKIKSKRE